MCNEKRPCNLSLPNTLYLIVKRHKLLMQEHYVFRGIFFFFVLVQTATNAAKKYLLAVFWARHFVQLLVRVLGFLIATSVTNWCWFSSKCSYCNFWQCVVFFHRIVVWCEEFWTGQWFQLCPEHYILFMNENVLRFVFSHFLWIPTGSWPHVIFGEYLFKMKEKKDSK